MLVLVLKLSSVLCGLRAVLKKVPELEPVSPGGRRDRA